MAAGPQRRTTPAAHLGAHIVPVERALEARAEVLEAQAAAIEAMANDAESAQAGRTKLLIAAEFRALAAELHHWG